MQQKIWQVKNKSIEEKTILHKRRFVFTCICVTPIVVLSRLQRGTCIIFLIKSYPKKNLYPRQLLKMHFHASTRI